MELIDKETVRRALPIAYLCFELGIPLNADGKRQCPFHNDHQPSFRTWVDEHDVQRWGCFPCGAKGDAFDLIGRIEGTGFTDSLLRARELLATMPPEWEGVGQELKRGFDRASAAEIVYDARRRASENLGWLCVAVGVCGRDADPKYRVEVDRFLAAYWALGLDESGNTVIPHYDHVGDLTGVKFRELGGGERWAMPGSSFDSLYGGWHRRRYRDVILCEGESDAWWCTLQGAPADVLALPAGAGLFLPQWADLKADCYVLAFDADPAGRNATAVWREALAGRYVDVLEPPDGEDLRSWRPPVSTIIQNCCKVEL